MGDNFDKTETGGTLEQGFNEAGNIAAEGIEAAKTISDKNKNAQCSENNTPGQEKQSDGSDDSAHQGAESPEKGNNTKSSGTASENNRSASKADNQPNSASNSSGGGGTGTERGIGATASEASTAGASEAGIVGTTGSQVGTVGSAGASTVAEGATSAASAGATSGVSAGATAGTAAGPAGTVIGAAVGAVLPKIIKWVFICLVLGLFLIGGIVEELVPNIITKPVATTLGIINGIYEKVKSVVKNMIDFFTGGSNIEEEEMVETLEEATQYCIDIIDEMLEASYEEAREDIKELCEEKGYDYDATMDSFSGQGGIYNSTNYALIIAAYSVSTDFTNVTVQEFKDKFRSKLNITYELSDEAQTKEVYDSLPIYVYEPLDVTICQDEDTDEDGDTDHDTSSYTIYTKTAEVDRREDGTGYWISDPDGEMVKNYVDATLIDHYDDECHDNDKLEGRYVYGPDVGEPAEIRVYPTKRIITYGEITMTPYQNSEVYDMFDVDPDAKYQDDYETTNRQMVEMRMKMMEGLVNTILTTAHVEYATNGLTKEQIEEYMASLPEDLSGNRKQVIKTALSLVGMVPYYYGGKPHNTGWNDNWWEEITPDPKGRRKAGLDCSGYVQWVFATAGFNGGNLDPSLLSTGSISKLQYITKDELQPGDIGLKYQGDSRHTGIYMGNDTWIHCSSSGTVVVAPGYSGFPTYKRYKPTEMENDNYYTDEITVYSKAPSYEYTGDKWYFISQCVYQECSTNVEGTIAVAECIKNRCLSPDFPNDPVAVLTQKSQFEAYGSGAYKKRTPTADQIELVKEGISGTKCSLYNQNVLFFVSTSYHHKHWNSSNWLYRAGYRVFGDYGDNTYYIKD